MSQGAIFKLVLRDERFDRFFTASDLLRTRIAAIRARRKAAGVPDTEPTFADIEQTHTLFVRSAYRPYVAIASEYARVKPTGDGAAVLGAGGATLQFTFPVYGHFTSDMALHVRFKPIGVPPPEDAPAPAPTAAAPYLRYCALPGVRMFQKVELRSEHVLIDDYTPDDVIARSKFFVGADQRTGWERCHGQQELREAVFFGADAGYTGTIMYRNGPQTPKVYHEGFDLCVPLDFWFCRSAAHALLNDLIPNTQRTITCELAPLADIVAAFVPDVNNETRDVCPPPALAGLKRVDLPFSRLAVEVELYVNSLYVNPEIHDIFASRIGFSLARVHRRQLNQLWTSRDSFLLDQLKYPAEYLLTGVRSRVLRRDFDRWWLMGAVPAATKKIIAPSLTLGAGNYVFAGREALDVTALDNMVESIGVTAHGIEIFPQLPAVFYSAYMPLRYTENTMVVSPSDPAAFLVNFCLYPGNFAPSGYYNLSAGREMYINYQLKPEVFIAGGDAEMVISMSALNFLIRRGDKLELKYAM